MKKFYEPKLLKLAKEKVLLEHTRIGKINKIDEDENFKQFLKILVKKKKNKVADYVKHTDQIMITKLCWYVPVNKYRYDYENLFIAISTAANESDWNILFSEWQNYYKNDEVRAYLGKAFEDVGEFKKCLSNKDIAWIKTKDVIDFIGNLCGFVALESDFALSMIRHGVNPERQLFADCLRRYLLYCNRNAYCNLDEKSILNAYNGYNEQERIGFVVNFVKQLFISDLDEYEKIYKAVKNTFFNEKSQKSLRSELEKNKLWSKYVEWCERIKLRTAFGGDPSRFNFWIRYLKGNKFIDTIDYVLYIDFGAYVAIEFKGFAAGPFYLFRKEFFDKILYTRMRGMNKQAFQNYLYSLYERREPNLMIRLEHRGSWQGDFAYNLSKYHIFTSDN